jgi:hypothetical protein
MLGRYAMGAGSFRRAGPVSHLALPPCARQLNAMPLGSPPRDKWTTPRGLINETPRMKERYRRLNDALTSLPNRDT